MAKYEVGRYQVTITSQGWQEASTGNMQFVLQFDVDGKIDPKDPDTLIAVAPGNRKFYKTLTEKTVDWLMDDLKAMGVENLSSWSQLDPNSEATGFIDLTGKTVDMLCGSKNGQDGKSYEDWSIARAGSTGKPIEAAPVKSVKALDRLFGKCLVKAAPAGSRGAPPRRAPQPAAVAATGGSIDDGGGVITDDDIPF